MNNGTNPETYNMSVEHNLERFIEVQKINYETALSEIKRGKKQSHWMWYIFPQIQGLGFSSTSKLYAIKDLPEAEEYLQHPKLGGRLLNICNELIKLTSSDAHAIFGTPDDLKLKSSLTLFSSVHNTNPVFQLLLEKFFHGTKDHKTLQIIGLA